MRRVLPPRSGLRRASPAPSLGRKKQPREAHSAGSRIGPGRLQQTARRVARQHRGAHQSRPRPCGERVADSMVTLLAYGSPPHMRGMPARTAFFCSSIGSPPAYAGKRFGMRSPTKKKTDHPRVCGKKVPCPQTETCRCGAPPHLRGTVLFCVIPVGMPPHGSPPRVRGKGGRVTFTLILSGSTPAYARKRSVTKPRRTKRTDHPRPCGEKLCTKDFIAPPSGSPPRVRGKARSYRPQC